MVSKHWFFILFENKYKYMFELNAAVPHHLACFLYLVNNLDNNKYSLIGDRWNWKHKYDLLILNYLLHVGARFPAQLFLVEMETFGPKKASWLTCVSKFNIYKVCGHKPDLKFMAMFAD